MATFVKTSTGMWKAFVRKLGWSPWTSGTAQTRLSLLPAAQEHIRVQDDGKNRRLRAVFELSQALALAVPHKVGIAERNCA